MSAPASENIKTSNISITHEYEESEDDFVLLTASDLSSPNSNSSRAPAPAPLEEAASAAAAASSFSFSSQSSESSASSSSSSSASSSSAAAAESTESSSSVSCELLPVSESERIDQIHAQIALDEAYARELSESLRMSDLLNKNIPSTVRSYVYDDSCDEYDDGDYSDYRVQTGKKVSNIPHLSQNVPTHASASLARRIEAATEAHTQQRLKDAERGITIKMRQEAKMSRVNQIKHKHKNRDKSIRQATAAKAQAAC